MSDGIKKDKYGGSYERLFITETYVRPGGFIYKETTLDGVLHAGPLNEPSAATFDPEGNPIHHTWHKAGVEHRLHGPSSVSFHDGTNRPKTETFKIEGKPRPSLDGPWMLRRDLDGSLWQEEYADGTVFDYDDVQPSLEP
ncbi:hypothetical protein J7443_15860 [Tropicibacter sp. R15_0]|uniref:hypothetical protein n=1 Tax=Tropicibacter sp. R15_0 TaxID=2821101 RepID=UPI001ADAB42C|nr:hypothetical protein [Tropicibacter sp. R15_0]MBO9466719.1 hypothetical protein [Tropicibacter sp. R15_0]